MTTLYVFTEELSAKNVFEVILPKILPADVPFKVYKHEGKQDLENALRKTLPTISKIPGAKILITRDQDSADCVELKNRLNGIVKGTCQCDYAIRIVCRELEAWFLGDLKAIQNAYPRFKSEQYQTKADFKDVDIITNPHQRLLKIVPEFTNKRYLPKIEVAQKIASFLEPNENRSTSFNHTVSAIKKLIES